MGFSKSNEDDVQRISTSVYVTNFPDTVGAKDLWNACKQYGYVVDVFIPSKRSKGGPVPRVSPKGINQDKSQKNNSLSYAYVAKGGTKENGGKECDPVLVLDDTCINNQDYSGCLNGKIQNFESISNLKVVLKNEGFDDISLRYLGGMWVMIAFKTVESKNKFSECVGARSWFSQLIQASNDFIIDERVTWVSFEGVPLKVWNVNTFKRIASKWGSLLTMENVEEDNLHRKRICVFTKGEKMICETFKINYQGKSYWLRAKETTEWNLDFKDISDDSSVSNDDHYVGSIKDDFNGSDTEDEHHEGEVKEVQGENEISVIHDTMFEISNPSPRADMDKNVTNECQSEDPFNIYSLLNKDKRCNQKEMNSNESLKYPLAKISKLDRFLLSKSLVREGSTLSVISLERKKDLKKELANLDATIDKGDATEDLIRKRVEIIKQIQDLDKVKSSKMIQKAKITWTIEGDENTKYFHGVLNKKRSQNAIRGVLLDGKWVDTPIRVKNEFLNHFKNRFEKPMNVRPSINMDFPRKLSLIQQLDLEDEVTTEEIKRAVCGYGIDKSSRPDGFTFRFYRRFWSIIGHDVVLTVKEFFRGGLVMVLEDLVSNVQSAFIKDRQIFDGPLILNELIQWCKAKKKRSFLFKIDFEKAYDSVRWDYIDKIQYNFGFGEKWRGWIQECLGLRGASGLHINLIKSKLIGITVGEDSVIQVADKIGCGVLKVPFLYLGSIVGANMCRISSWKEVVGKMEDRLSTWKMKSLSIGGRLTLLKAVLGSMPIYHMSLFKVPKIILHRMESIRCHFFNGIEQNSKKAIWVKWNKVLAAKERGGLGVSSLYALNRALLSKWVWRLATQKDSLWASVIQAIHGVHGKAEERLYALELDKKISVASKCAQENFTSSFRREPRSGVESTQLNALILFMNGVVIGVTPDRWFWSLNGSGEFLVLSVRNVIDERCLPVVSIQTRWSKEMVPYEAFACPCGAEDVVLRESYKPKTNEVRVRLPVGSPRASTTPIYSPRSSPTPIYSPRSSTPPRYSPGASTPQSYSLRISRNAECSNCKHLLDKITVLEATVDMYMHPEQHTVNSAALFHEVYNNMGKLDLE
nr:RNA-directed DNA polymerase, eukaryota, reverse transcriptase zinc-binding domain protein [Tanacetum cinerariifolium]